ncbi:MAG: LysR family transcriptional regulator [Collinsella sp.]
METNIQKMQVLLETVRAGSFTCAAERLSYSQSGVSRMVGDLEADWGFKVLDRSREGVVLSADGRQVMPAVEALCEEFTRLQRRVDEMRGLMRGKICIGTFSSVATHVLPPVIARFRADHPDIDYELLMGDYSEIEQWVAEGRCDLGFIPREPRGAGMASRPLVQDELMAVVPADSSLAAAEVVSLADLANEQFILLERGSDDEITPLFRRAGLTARSKLSTWDDYAIMAMVEDGLGVSILPALILRRCQFDVAVRPLEGIPIGRSMPYIARLTFLLRRLVSLNISKSAYLLSTLDKSRSSVRFLMKLNFRMRRGAILLAKLNSGSIRVL